MNSTPVEVSIVERELTYPNCDCAIDSKLGLTISAGCHRLARHQIPVSSQQSHGQTRHQNCHLKVLKSSLIQVIMYICILYVYYNIYNVYNCIPFLKKSIRKSSNFSAFTELMVSRKNDLALF